MKTIHILSDQPVHALLTSSVINKYTDGRLIAYADDGKIPLRIRDTLIAAGLVDAEPLPAARPASFDELVHVRAEGDVPNRDPAGRRISRRFQLPPLDRPEDLFRAYSRLAAELRDHYRLELPAWKHPRDQWTQTVTIGGPSALQLPKERIRFRGHRVCAVAIRPAQEGLSRDSLTLYELEAGGHVVLYRHSKDYLPEDGYSYFLGADRSHEAAARALQAIVDRQECPFGAKERLCAAVGTGFGTPLSGAQVKQHFPELIPAIAAKGRELDNRTPAPCHWYASRMPLPPRVLEDVMEA